MSLLRRSQPWREPPIVFQILVLLLAGLVVAQLVTLLLTLVLPPSPPVEHSFGDVVAALKGEENGGRLKRAEQSGPPDIGGPGWFTSAESRHQLATMLAVRDEDVRLAFFAPLPFAGITAPPSLPQVPVMPMRPVAWQVWPEPLRSMPTRPTQQQARLIPASLIMGPDGPPGGGGFGGNFPSGGPNGLSSGGMPGGLTNGGGGFGDHGPLGSGYGNGRGSGNRGGQGGGDRGPGGAQQGASGGGRPASPSDLDHQPVGPYAHDEDGEGRAGLLQPFDNGRVLSAGSAVNQPLTAPQPLPAAPQTTTPNIAATPSSPRPDTHPVERPTPLPAVAVIAPTRVSPPAAIIPHPAAPQTHALPITQPSRALFGLAPAPFVEGDFVAALRQADGRWVVVQPAPQAFPNAWQRRVILWFAIAFALVAPVGWLFANHIVRPLARFTAAAEQLGRDPSAALVTLEGPAEIGRAARAFNVMQNRLRSFVDDRTAMVGAISHDLRTPLTRLRFRIEEVEDDGIREGMNDEVAEMEAMITSVLSFIRDASTPNARERLDLGMLMEDVAQDAAMVGSDVTIERTTSAPVEVDVLGMRRLLANLVENAVKYGERARIRLGVDEHAAIAEIIDDGPGVPDDELERAFEPFYRASNATNSGKSGTGLGLAVCRSIARAHGGDVRLLRSSEGFSAELRLPLAYDAGRIAA